MPATVVVTRDVEPRYRGFLASAMLEVAPGVYVAPAMSRGVRERVWSVMGDWFDAMGNGAITIVWRDSRALGGLSMLHLGDPPKEIREADGVLLVKRVAKGRQLLQE